MNEWNKKLKIIAMILALVAITDSYVVTFCRHIVAHSQGDIVTVRMNVYGEAVPELVFFMIAAPCVAYYFVHEAISFAKEFYGVKP
jgi:hypothetical protein